MTPWTRPPALRPGDLLGVCAPAGPIDAARLDQGVAELESLGYRVRVTPATRGRFRFNSGTVEERLADLQSLLSDPEVRGVVAARGGAGSGWLVPHLDAGLLGARPRALVGYSDLTLLHLLSNRAHVVSFHGPMVARELATGNYDRPSFAAALGGEGPPYRAEPGDLAPLRRGEAEGRLRGGCLSILAAAAGTPWALTTEGEPTILFMEDVDEKPFRIDRMLMQLRHSGALAGVRGIVFGDMKGCSPRLDAGYGLEEVLLDALSGLDVPIALGLSSGHTASPNVTLPLGARARLSCGEDARFEILEASVS
ncbi:MAG TPA: LD-carboxypeptidase [Vicinamibacteria bacterium]|nr:LD-carboxypeptidase [Vicinamibacteria bacterium]